MILYILYASILSFLLAQKLFSFEREEFRDTVLEKMKQYCEQIQMELMVDSISIICTQYSENKETTVYDAHEGNGYTCEGAIAKVMRGFDKLWGKIWLSHYFYLS